MDIENLSSLHDEIRRSYNNAFNKKGFVLTQPAALIPDDKSVYFTSATINRFKEYMQDENFSQRYICNQTCMRLPGLSHVLEANAKPYFSVFNMLGTFISEESINDLAEGIVSFFDDRKYSVYIKAHSHYTKIPEDIKKYPVSLDTEQDDYYKWKFGVEDIEGTGITFVAQKKSEKPIEIGQLIKIRNKKNGKQFYEFAVGLESCARAEIEENGFREAFIPHQISKKYGFDKNWRLTESLSTSLYMLDAGVNTDQSKRGQLLRKTLRNLAYTCILSDIEPVEINDYIEELHSVFRLKNSIDIAEKEIRNSYQSARNNLVKFEKYLLMLENETSITSDKKSWIQRKAFIKAGGECYIPDPVRDQILFDRKLIDSCNNTFCPQYNFKKLYL